MRALVVLLALLLPFLDCGQARPSTRLALAQPEPAAGKDGIDEKRATNRRIVEEQADDTQFLTPRSGGWLARKVRQAIGRQTVGGSTGDAPLSGAGASNYVGAFGRHTFTDGGQEILATSGYFDRLYVTLNRGPGAGNSVTVTLRLDNTDTTIKATLTDGQTQLAADYWVVPFRAGSTIDVKVDTSAGMPANNIALSWAAGFVPAPTDRVMLYARPGASSLIGINKAAAPECYTEIPPWIVRVPQVAKQVWTCTTGWTVLAQSDAKLTSGAVTASGGTRITGPDATKPWARSYDGVFGSYTSDEGSGSQAIWFVRHGENKNEADGAGAQRVNTVNPAIAINLSDPNTWSGFRGPGSTTYGDGYAAYSTFTTLAYVPSNAGNGYGLAVQPTDLGPIMWPRGGYLNQDGSLATSGLSHPSPYSDGTHLYVYARDGSPVAQGIVVARALLSDLKAASDADKPKQFKTWCGSLGWLPSLPAGFDKANIAAFWKTPGPPSVAVAQHRVFAGRFQVAKVEGTASWLAVGYWGESLDPGDPALPVTWYTTIYRTTDLVTFEEAATIAQGSPNTPRALNYPVFVNAAGTDNMNIALGDFHVMGSDYSVSGTNVMHILAGERAVP